MLSYFVLRCLVSRVLWDSSFYFSESTCFWESVPKWLSTVLDLFPASLPTFLEVPEEDKPFRCTFPTVRKNFFAGAVDFEHFCFSKSLKVFPCKFLMNFFFVRNFWIPRSFKCCSWGKHCRTKLFETLF